MRAHHRNRAGSFAVDVTRTLRVGLKKKQMTVCAPFSGSFSEVPEDFKKFILQKLKLHTDVSSTIVSSSERLQTHIERRLRYLTNVSNQTPVLDAH